jgi:hypothetical protein
LDQHVSTKRFERYPVVAYDGPDLVVAYKYTTSVDNTARATLYISDPDVVEGLAALLGKEAKPVSASDKLESHRTVTSDLAGARGFVITPSLAHALRGMGVAGEYMGEGRIFEVGGETTYMMRSKPSDETKNWSGSPEFKAFWTQHLGADIGYMVRDQVYPIRCASFDVQFDSRVQAIRGVNHVLSHYEFRGEMYPSEESIERELKETIEVQGNIEAAVKALGG